MFLPRQFDFSFMKTYVDGIDHLVSVVLSLLKIASEGVVFSAIEEPFVSSK